MSRSCRRSGVVKSGFPQTFQSKAVSSAGTHPLCNSIKLFLLINLILHVLSVTLCMFWERAMALDVEKMEIKLGAHSSFLYHHLFYSYFPVHLLLLALQVGLPLFSFTGLAPPTDSSCPSLSQAIWSCADCNSKFGLNHVFQFCSGCQELWVRARCGRGRGGRRGRGHRWASSPGPRAGLSLPLRAYLRLFPLQSISQDTSCKR